MTVKLTCNLHPKFNDINCSWFLFFKVSTQWLNSKKTAYKHTYTGNQLYRKVLPYRIPKVWAIRPPTDLRWPSALNQGWWVFMWLVINDQCVLCTLQWQDVKCKTLCQCFMLLNSYVQRRKTRNVISLMKYPENPVDELKLLKFSFVIMIWKLSSFSECYSIDVY